MKRNRLRSIILLGLVSIIGIIIFQLFWVYRTFSSIDDQFNQSVKIALLNVAHDLAEFNHTQVQNENPVKQISYNYFVIDVNSIIEPSILEHFLKNRLSHSNIELDYEYAIYDCYTDKMVYGNYLKADEEGVARMNTTEFKKVDEYLYYFGVSFPTKTMYLLSGTYLWFISGLVLISALAFFTYATYELLRQKRLSEVQKEFINNMTHELKTPVSTIGISSKVLSDPSILNDPERFIKYAAIIAHQNKRLEEKIEQILQVASLEKTKIDLHIEPIVLSAQLHNIAESFKVKLEDKKGEIDVVVIGEPSISADAFLFSNMLFNLLDNAVKYCNAVPDISITAKEERSHIVLTVEDNGLGIEEKYRKKIFQKFYRIPTGDVHNVKGFGIGLNYVQKIVSIHGWRIAVEGKTEGGSKFIISIPKK